MTTIALSFATLSALLSTAFFVLESLVFTKRVGRATFRTTEEQANATKLWAFNQGFYNLFLAVGTLVGVLLIARGNVEAGRPLVFFGCGSMVAAAVVLVMSGGASFVRGAIAQGVPPLVAIATLLM